MANGERSPPILRTCSQQRFATPYRSLCSGTLPKSVSVVSKTYVLIGTTYTQVAYHLQESVMTIGLILSLIFMVLKLTGNIDWHWGLVFLPAIIEFVLSLVVYRSPFWWRGRVN
jgi:hypothetical protein